MPNQPMQVNPVITVNDNGQEVISDLSVSTGHSGAVGRDGQVKNADFDYYEDQYGQVHHRFSDIELQSDKKDQGIYFDESEYIDALIEANPKIPAAQQWCMDNLPAEWIDDYNKQIESGSLDEMNQAVEWLLEQYGQRQTVDNRSQEQEEMPEDPEMDELSEEETEILNNAVDNLERQEAIPEMAADWQEEVEIAQQSGDETYATVAAATAAFHAGQVSAEEAIDFCLTNCDLKELARVYNNLLG